MRKRECGQLLDFKFGNFFPGNSDARNLCFLHVLFILLIYGYGKESNKYLEVLYSKNVAHKSKKNSIQILSTL